MKSFPGVLLQDNSNHGYFIPTYLVTPFAEMCEQDEDDALDTTFGQYRLARHPSGYLFHGIEERT